uniref:Uncharacterized protein n=2 Tax=Compsopogon caeruleus TaxID=31354 RepID=A0A7S1TFP9_9RHOD|mmetsp:Transcript_4965/g.10016  ORF Transcript_4965/g.10016 Transcript_4965/m.10016 type:complete len:241 (+) Transcript_4965:172-894(+)
MYGVEILGAVALSATNVALAASVMYSLRKAAVAGRLGSETYRRLNLGLFANSLTAVVFILRHAIFFSPGALQVVVLANLLTAIVCLRIWSVSVRHENRNVAIAALVGVRRTFASLAGAVRPRNGTSLIYAVLFWLLASISGGAMFLPSPSQLSSGAPLVAAIRLWAAQQGFLHGAVLYSLKDASDRGRLSASTFRNLNLGLAVTFTLRSVIQGLVAMIVSLAIAVFGFYNYVFTATRPSS